MTKMISLSKSMPLTVGLIAGTFIASYILSSLNAEFEIGRPGSTAAIGYLFVPIYTGIAALIGVGIGFSFKAILKDRGEKDRISLSLYLLATTSILLLSWYVAANIGFQQVEKYEEFNKPKLLSNSGGFIKTSIDHNVAHSAQKHAKLVWDRESIEPFFWADKEVLVKVKNSTLMKIIINKAESLSYDVRNYSYITEVSVIDYPGDREVYSNLVVIIKLRATSSRSIMLIYNKDHQLVYEELLDRCGRKQYVGIARTNNGKALVSHLCTTFMLTRPNKASQPTQKNGTAEL